MNWRRRVVQFACHDCWLVGVLHMPDAPLPRGLLIVTGGPQYRVGSHRHFVLLAEQLAAAGIPVMRFDYRGMGDSEGDPRDYTAVDDDLAAAIGHFFSLLPGMRDLVLWGLCDGATAAAGYAALDRRVAGLIMLNPWVRTEQGLARVTLRHYYVRRLLDKDFWRKLASGAVGVGRTLSSFIQLASAARQPQTASDMNVPQRLYLALSRYRGRLLIVLSGADLGAREFSALPARHAHWRKLLAAPRVRTETIAQANHTFASKAWRDDVTSLCRDWIASW
jgi:exosortase A-associated hydrolase 1